MTDLSLSPATAADRHVFYSKYKSTIMAAAAKHHTCGLCLLAQAANESSWGRSRGVLDDNNLFRFPCLAAGAMALLIAILPSDAVKAAAPNLEVAVFDRVYVNDAYGFALPLPPHYKACYVPPYGAGNVVVLIRESRHCSTRILSPSIVISAFYGQQSPDARADMAKKFCDSARSVATQLHFGSEPLFKCDDKSRGSTTLYAVKAASEVSNWIEYEYCVTIHKTKIGQEPSNAEMSSIFSAVRFLRP
jgi:hypothetical protein